MSESYCMKSCTECAREGCPGCRSGAFSEQCEIWKCCRDTMHESCETCTNRSFCGKWRGRDQMPQKAIYMKSRAEVQAEKSRVAAVALAKWVKVIFWAMIASNVVSLSALLETLFPAVHWVEQTGNFVISLFVCWGYYSMRRVNWGFRTIAVMQLAGAVISLVSEFFPDERPLKLILLVPAAVLGIILFKHRSETYRDVLSNICAELSDKWEKQWRLYSIGMGLLVGGLVAARLIPMLGLLVALGGIGLLLFTAIREYVLLWQTAQVCEVFTDR